MNSFGPLELLVIVVAVVTDVAVGEVPPRFHPVVGMGKVTLSLLRKSPTGLVAQLLFGAGVVFVVAGGSVVAAFTASYGVRQINTELAHHLPYISQYAAPTVTVVLEGVLLSTLFAIRGLLVAGANMRRALGSSLAHGRAALGHLCSRNSSTLNESELCGATVESLSENTSDSFVAPLFWYALFAWCGAPGLCGAAAYRAVNTLDAMVGYRGKYEYIGKTAARLDDVVNFIPARLTAVLLLASATLGARPFGFAPLRSLSVLWRDHASTESPNAGWPMAATAGALQVELAKHDHYTLGAGLPHPTLRSISLCERLVSITAILWLLCLAAWSLGATAYG